MIVISFGGYNMAQEKDALATQPVGKLLVKMAIPTVTA